MSKSVDNQNVFQTISNEREIRYIRYENDKNNPLSDICQYLDTYLHKNPSQENMELTLEVDINESLKDILGEANSESDELLDVTIIRPSVSQATYERTIALKKKEVRDFVTLVEQYYNSNKCEDIKQDSEICGKHISHDCNFKRNISSCKEKKKPEDSSTADHLFCGNQKHVYATVDNFERIKDRFACQNKDKEDCKPGTPCLCRNCGIVGVLVESQKGPVGSFPPLDISSKSMNKQSNRRGLRSKTSKIKSPKTNNKESLDQSEVLKEINDRLKVLEKRMNIQEETSVPREYLKYVLQKVVAHYNVLNNTSRNMKNNSTQYSSKNLTKKFNLKDNSIFSYNKERSSGKTYRINTALPEIKDEVDIKTFLKDENFGCYIANSCKTFNTAETKIIDQVDIKTSLKSENIGIGVANIGTQNSHKITSNQTYNGFKEKPRHEKSKTPSKDLTWLWGEETVKPGCDLKNKIVQLFEETFFKNRSSKQNTTNNGSKFNKVDIPQDIKVECDDQIINLNTLQQTSVFDMNNFIRKNCEKEGKSQTTHTNKPNNNSDLVSNSGTFGKTTYPFDVKNTQDDSTFRRNIELCREKFKDKPTKKLENKFFNKYVCQSIGSESKASFDYVSQKIRHNLVESGLTEEKEIFLNRKFNIPDKYSTKESTLREKMNSRIFRKNRDDTQLYNSIDVTYVNPKIHDWLNDSSASESKPSGKQGATCHEMPVPLAENKESLICKYTIHNLLLLLKLSL